VEELRLVARGSLARDAAERGVDLGVTLSVYNFDFWFDGCRGVVVLDLDDPCVAVVSVDGDYAVYCRHPTDPREAVRRLRWCLGIDEDLGEFLSIARSDELLKGFAARFSGWRLRSSSLWWGLVVGVCQQNASFRQGWSMLRKLIVSYGRRARAGDNEVLLPPRPRDVLENPAVLTEARLGYRASTVVRIAEAFEGGVLSEEKLASLSPEEIEGALRSVKGVGSYTARLAMALGLRVYDLPPVDRWVRALASRAYGVPEREVERFWRGRWGRWSALAVIALTIALDAQPLRKALERLEKGELVPDPSIVPSPLTLWRASDQTR